MQKTVLRLLAFIGATCFISAQAASIATIVSQESTVWVLRGETRTELNRKSELIIGDHIFTSDTGRVEMELWSDVTLWLDNRSDVLLQGKAEDSKNPDDTQTSLQILNGSVCLKNKIPAHASGDLKVKIGATIFAVLVPTSHICVKRENWFWSIQLLAGSASVTYFSDSNVVGLNQPGTELRIDDFGSYELLFTGIDKLLNPERKPSTKTVSAPVKKVKPAEPVSKPKKISAARIAAATEIVKPAVVAITVPSKEALDEIETIAPVQESPVEAPTITGVTETPVEAAKIVPKVEAPVELASVIEQTDQKNDYPTVDIEADIGKALDKYYAGYPYQAIDMIKPVALSGDAKAQFVLGNILYSLLSSDEFTITEDPVEWYKLAAAQNYPNANYALGAIYQNKWVNSEGKADLGLAISYYGQADKLGHKGAKTSLGNLQSMVKSPKKTRSYNFDN